MAALPEPLILAGYTALVPHEAIPGVPGFLVIHRVTPQMWVSVDFANEREEAMRLARKYQRRLHEAAVRRGDVAAIANDN